MISTGAPGRSTDYTGFDVSFSPDPASVPGWGLKTMDTRVFPTCLCKV